MSDNNISDRSNHIINQWQVNQAEEQQEQQQIKQQVIKDQLIKSEIAAAPVIATYSQDAHIPKLLDPAPQNAETEQNANGEGGNESTEFLLNKAQYILKEQTVPGQARLPFTTLAKDGGNPDENALKQFAQENGLDPGAARIAYSFAKANPDQELKGPFANIAQSVPAKAQNSELKQSIFNNLLNGAGSQLQQLANKLGVTPEQARELVNQAFVSGQSDNPDVQEFADNLGAQAESQSNDSISDQTFERAMNGVQGSIKNIAKQLDKTPDEVREMLKEARANPNADLPPEIKTLARNVQLQADKYSEEPTLDPKEEFTRLITSSDGSGAKKVQHLAKELNLSEDEVKELLQKAADDPNADVPVEISRAAGKLMEKATNNTMDAAKEHLAGQLMDEKIAAGGDKIEALAKKLGISLEEAKALLQKGMADPDSVPKSVMKLLKQMMEECLVDAQAQLSGEPTAEDMGSSIDNEMNNFFNKAMSKEGLLPQAQKQVLFAKQNPQLAEQLDPDVAKAAQEITKAGKEGLEDTFGIPQSYDSETETSLTTSLTNIGTTTYDEAFESSLENLRDKGQINDKTATQLRQLHYNPNGGYPSSDEVKALFEQIEGQIIPEVRAQLGAPATWTPKPGMDRFGAIVNGELGMVLEKAIAQLKEGGQINSDQAKQIQKQLAGKADAPQELQAMIRTLLGNAVTLVSNKYGISPGSLELDEPLAPGKLSGDIAAVAKSSLNMADEVYDNFKLNIKEAKSSPLNSIYVDFLKLTREALAKCKEYLYLINAGDATRAKNMAVTELSKQMNRLEQMKRQFAERDKMIEKMEGLGILMIFLMIILAVIMILLAVIMIGGIIGLVMAIIIAVMEVINIALQATDSPAAEAFSYVTMAVELVMSFVQIAMAPMKAAMTAAASAIKIGMAQGTVQAAKAVISAIATLLWAMLTSIMKAAFDSIKEALSAVGKAMKDMAKALVKTLTQMMEGGLSEVGKMATSAVDSLVPVSTDMLSTAASPAQQARIASASAPSASLSDAFKNLMDRMMERVMILFQNLVQSVGEGMKAFSEGIDELCSSVANFCKSPVETIKEAFQGVKDVGSNFADVLNIQPFKEVKDPVTGTVSKEINWMHDYADEAFVRSEGGQINSKMKMVLNTGEALTGGGKTLVSGLKDNAQADSEAIMLRLDAWLAESAEMLKFIRKCINNLLSNLSEPVDQIKAISESQSKFWKDLSGVGTGLAQSLQG